jgi:hypothetical protein
MAEWLSRQELYDLVWSEPMRSLASRFGISDVALKKTCTKAHIPTPERGYWARKEAGQKVSMTSLPERPPAMDDQVLVAGGNKHWYRSISDEEALGPLPPPPVFETPIEQVREHIAKIVGRVTVPRDVRVWHPAIQKLLDEDKARREKQLTWSWEKPCFDSALDRRRLRLLNSLLVAVGKFNGQASPEGDAKKDSISFYHQHVPIMHAPPKRSRRTQMASQPTGDNELVFSILQSFHSEEEEVRSWSDGPEQKLEAHLTEIAIEVVLRAEVLYREGVQRQYAHRVERKSRLEEELRRQKAEAEKAERERLRKLEQARIDRLLADAAALQQAMVIRDYVQRIRSAQATAPTVPHEELQKWADWASAQADRLDPSLGNGFLVSMPGER